MTKTPDDIDKKILWLVSVHGRMTHEEIARRVYVLGLPSTSELGGSSRMA